MQDTDQTRQDQALGFLSLIAESFFCRSDGELREVFPTGANNVYRIVNEKGQEFLFPAVDAMIAKTDIEAGKLFVKPIPGIFNDEGETILNVDTKEDGHAD